MPGVQMNSLVTAITQEVQYHWSDAIHGTIATVLVLLVISQFLSLFAGVFASSSATQAFRQLEKYRGYLLLALLAAGLISSFVGSLVDSVPKGSDSGEATQITSPRFYSDHFYRGWGQFFGEGEVAASDSIWTRLGRMLGLTFLAMVAYEAFVRFFSEPVQSLRMRLQRQHVVICGLGRIGRVLARDLLEKKQAVTIIEQNPLRPGIDEMRNKGAIVLIGDASQDGTLRKAGCQRAKEMFVVTGSDEVNLDIAADIMQLQAKDVGSKEIPKLHLHLHQLRLESVLLQHAQRLGGDSNAWTTQIRVFNPLEESLSHLFDEYVLRRRPRASAEVAHYILVGFGNTNQSLANFLAENAHFSNLKRARITIAYRSEEESAVRRFQSLYPKFFPATPHLVPDAWHPPAALDRWGYGVELVSKSGDQVPTTVEDVDWNRSCGVPFAVNGGFVQMEGGATSPSFVDPLIAVCKTPNVRPIVFIGSSNDEENCAEAIELRELLDERLKIDNRSRYANRDNEVSIFAYVPEHPSLFALMNSRLQPDQPLDCVAWGDCKASCTYEQLNSELVRKLAEELFYDFYRDRTKPFFKASPWEIQSNRKAALHLNTKLSVFSLKIITPPKDEPLADDRSLVPGSRLGSADALMRHCVERKRKIQGLSADERSLDAEIRRLLETTVRMEHNRYLAERLLQDWSVGQRSLKGELENRRRPGMVDWDNLQPADRQKDQKQIQRILDSMIHYSQTKENIRLSLAFRSDSEDLMPPDSDSQSTPEPKHLNAGGQLLPEFGAILRVATKHQSLWARRVTETEQIASLESKSQTAKAGDFVCRGIQGELWPQSEKSLLGSYTASGEKDTQGFERYDPRPDAPAVEATQVNEPFYVIASWGRLDGKPGDYVVRRQNDPSDIWIVDRAIFENSYKFQTE